MNNINQLSSFPNQRIYLYKYMIQEGRQNDIESPEKPHLKLPYSKIQVSAVNISRVPTMVSALLTD